MGISYNAVQIFGSHIRDNKAIYGNIDITDFENKIKDVYNIVLNEELYEELIEEGASEDALNLQEYASEYHQKPFHEYKTLMLIEYGNFMADYRDPAVGFLVDLNQDSFEQIEEKKTIFLQELADFKAKTGFEIEDPQYLLLTSVM